MAEKMTQKDRLNELARELYAAQGYNVEKGYDFSTANHPQEKGMFATAVITFNYWHKYFTG